MVDGLRMTSSVTEVIGAFLENPDAQRYGMELMAETGLPSGTLYPILVRLEEAGWVETAWEDIDPHVEGRPARRYYTLTADGAEAAQSALSDLHRKLSKALRVGKPRTA